MGVADSMPTRGGSEGIGSSPFIAEQEENLLKT